MFNNIQKFSILILQNLYYYEYSSICIKILIEFFKNVLVLLSASAINVKDLSKEFIDNLKKATEEKLLKENITDQDRYLLNHKIDVIKEIRV